MAEFCDGDDEHSDTIIGNNYQLLKTLYYRVISSGYKTSLIWTLQLYSPTKTKCSFHCRLFVGQSHFVCCLSSIRLRALQNEQFELTDRLTGFSKNKYIPFNMACTLVKTIKTLSSYQTTYLHSNTVTLSIYFKIRSLLWIEHIASVLQRSASFLSESEVATYFETNLNT
jgi:hypothetical protein